MKKIIYACEWGKDRTKAWSGTYMGLYNALKKYYIVEDFDISLNSNEYKYNPIITFQRIKEKMLRKTGFPDFEIGRIKLFNKIAEAKFGNVNDSVIVQFSECPDIFGSKNFVYQDLHVGYVKKMYDSMPEIFAISGFQCLGKNAIYNREEVQRNFYNKASAIFTMGKWLSKELIEEYGMPRGKVFYTGGGYNLDPSQIDTTYKTGNKILFVGRDYNRKNGPLVLEAFKLAITKCPDLELYIAGPKNLNIDVKGVTCLGNLDSSDLVKYFNMCDIFCMPSLFEAYGLVFAEALTFGLPCIGRDAYEMPYFIEEGKTGYLLHHQDANELANLMLKLIADEQIKKNVRLKRDWFIQEYSWDTVAKRMVAVIDKN